MVKNETFGLRNHYDVWESRRAMGQTRRCAFKLPRGSRVELKPTPYPIQRSPPPFSHTSPVKCLIAHNNTLTLPILPRHRTHRAPQNVWSTTERAES